MSFLFGGSSKQQAPASVQTVSQTTEFPTEVQPFITDVLEKAKAQQEGREFELFEGPRIAPFTTEEETAFTGIEGLAQAGLGSYPDMASSAFYAQQAQDAAEQGLRQMEAADVARLTNPFQQNVIDLEKEEAIRQFEGTTLPQIGAQAAGAGGFGGSRQAILEAEAQRNLQQQLGDIQSRGLRDAYDLAARQFEAERGRQAQGAGQFAGFAQTFPGQAMRELGALQSVGEQRKAVDQRALDIALSDFLTEQEFPTRQLQEYQSLIRGFPIQPNIFRQEVQSLPAVPLSQQLLGLGAAGAGIAGQLGAFNRKSGGQIEGGLSSLEKHQDVESSRTLGDMTVEDIMYEIRGGEFPSELIEKADRYLETIPGYKGGKDRSSASYASALRDMMTAGQLDRAQVIPQGRVDIPDRDRNEQPVVAEEVSVTETEVPTREDIQSLLEMSFRAPTSSPLPAKKEEKLSITDTTDGGGTGGSPLVTPPLTAQGLLDKRLSNIEDLKTFMEEYSQPSAEEVKFRELITTRLEGLDEKKQKDIDNARLGFFKTLTDVGMRLGGKFDPQAGGLLGQIASAGADVKVGDQIAAVSETITDIGKESDNLQLKLTEAAAGLGAQDRKAVLGNKLAVAKLENDAYDTMVDYLADLAAAQGIDLQGTFSLRFDNLKTQLGESGHNVAILNSKQQKRLHDLYGEAVGEAITELQETAQTRPGRTIFGPEMDTLVLKKVIMKINKEPGFEKVRSTFDKGKEPKGEEPKNEGTGSSGKEAIRAQVTQQQNKPKNQ